MAQHRVTATVVIFLCVVSSHGLFEIFKWKCPPLNDILPCTCDKDDNIPILNCKSVTVADDLTYALRAVKNQKKKVAGVKFHSVALRYLPDDIFNGTNIEFLEITDSSILSLGEHDHALLGLENTLLSLSVINCSYVNDWKWLHLQNLTKLQRLVITDSNLMELSDDFLQLSHFPILDLSFKKNLINYLPYRAFAKYKSLNKVFLDHNEIREFTRSMLPLPAKKLESLGLSYNKISSLANNTFIDMPSLKFLFLGGNPIHSLKSEIFLPVWKKLKLFLVQESPIICDCRINWLVKEKRSKLLMIAGKCFSPQIMKGKRIADLKPLELDCEN